MDERSAEGNSGKETLRDHLFSDRELTQRRYQELRAYYGEHVLGDGGFVCEHETDCKDECKACFSATSLPYIGRHYDMRVSGKLQRLAVISLDAPKQGKCDLEERRRMFGRYLKKSGGPANPHMRGTEQILRTMLGIRNGKDDGDRFLHVDGEPAYIFETFSFLNICMCPVRYLRDI